MAVPQSYFPGVPTIPFEGPDSDNPLAFKHYDADALVMGRPMRDHLRFAVCAWHTVRATGADPFGVGCRPLPWRDHDDPMTAARCTLDALFELMTKLGVRHWTFHDRDIAPERPTLRESDRDLDAIVDHAEALQRQTGITPLWGTACLFAHPRYMGGAATSPCPRVFAHAAGQVAKAMEVTQRLGGAGFVFWGGREGYETLLNTDLRRELHRLGLFLRLAADHADATGFRGTLYIEPKPKEPTTHQYDFDASSCHAFLIRHGLEGRFRLNIEANHATLAGHSFHHELEYAAAHDLLGSVDANRGDPTLGWDTDQFPLDLRDATLAMLTILRAGGFVGGGLNFDAKLRRQSTDPTDLFHAHIGAMDAFARGLRAAARLIADRRLAQLVADRYRGWSSDLGQRIERGGVTLVELAHAAADDPVPDAPPGRQELAENIVNEAIR